MTQKEFTETNWHRGNVVKLENGKEYLVKRTKSHGKYLLLYSEEYDKCFIADHNIVDCRTSDYEEPIEVYLEHKRQHQEEAAAKREAERLAKKAERQAQKAAAKQAQKAAEKPIVKAEPIVKIEPVKAEPVAAPAPTSEQTPEQPKRKRQRIRIKRVEKIEIK